MAAVNEKYKFMGNTTNPIFAEGGDCCWYVYAVHTDSYDICREDPQGEGPHLPLSLPKAYFDNHFELETP